MKKIQQDINGLQRYWKRIPLVLRAILIGFTISSLGVFTGVLIGSIIPLPWSLILMTGFLWAYIKFFSGRWKPEANRNYRKRMFRSQHMSRRSWLLSIAAIVCIVLIEQSGLVITFRLMEFPADKFIEEYGFIKDIPVWAGWLMIVMISAVAGICEETGFRGYMQVPLENRYSPLMAISVVSIVFVLVHLHQAWSGPILIQIFFISVLFGSIAYYSGSLIPGIIAHFIMDVFNFSFWWTDLGGQFNKETLAVTGLDGHFIFWMCVQLLSLFTFIVILRALFIQNKNKEIISVSV